MNYITTVNMNKRIPQVLLLGNGLTRNTGYSWEQFIEKCVRKDVDLDLYKKDGVFQVPNTILSLATMNADDTQRHSDYAHILSEIQYVENLYINQLIKLPVDSVLTTNYTYEIEYAMENKYPDLAANDKRKYSHCTEKDAKYLIHTYNRFEKFPHIWHIHGEARRKSSLILSHDEYARLTNKIIEFLNGRKNHYVKYSDNIQMKSWIDYFVLSDLYILGCGLDFAEFDLWWLINRRLREKATIGKIYFYEPETHGNQYKLTAMRNSGIEVETLNIKIKEDDDKTCKYDEFYCAAIRDIETKIKE